MTTQFSAHISEAQHEVWPLVKEAIARSQRSGAELMTISDDVFAQMEAKIDAGQRPPDKRRRVVEQTVWLLAQLGWLRLGAERELILAAKAWADMPQGPEEVLDRLEDGLLRAVSAMPDYLP